MPLPSSLFCPIPTSRPENRQLRYGIVSWGLFREGIGAFFPGAECRNPLRTRLDSDCDAILAWGTKPSSVSANVLAMRRSIPLLRIEDGFLYGLEPCSRRMGLVVDDLGIYYDASSPSRLESYIALDLSPGEMARSQAIRGLWLEHGVSKYNHGIDWRGLDPWFDEPFLLVIDQTRGDQSIVGALADESSFVRMLDAALSQTAIEHIVIKVHPEVIRGSKVGHFDLSASSSLWSSPRVRVLMDDVSLPSVIQRASAIYTVSSQAGFEGLLWDKPVHTFGMPFYAGWGLTHDDLARPDRRQDICLEQLIHGALVNYSRYVHPETNHAYEIEDLIAYLGFQRRMRNRFQKPLLPAYFSRNKLRHLKRFTQGGTWVGSKAGGGTTIESGHDILIWGTPNAKIRESSSSDLIHVEDGFIRSVGLGATLAKPFSWVFDRQGIYYDAQRPSDLEDILEHGDFDEAMLRRARKLQDQIVASGISKYNLPDSHLARRERELLKTLKENSAGKKVLLVIGQVETDASIQYGGVDVRTNLDLLNLVRERYPDACIVYKPHPDIAKSVRFAGKTSNDHRLLCELVVSELSLSECLVWVDELCTISSLSGFEALIRGVTVHCYGLPFYAGWGLTFDRHRTWRRTRKRSIEELIAGALILYPSYVHPQTGLYCTPESLITALHEMNSARRSSWSRVMERIRGGGLEFLMGVANRFRRS